MATAFTDGEVLHASQLNALVDQLNDLQAALDAVQAQPSYGRQHISGVVDINVPAAGTNVSAAISFPPGTFTQPPAVTLTFVHTNPSGLVSAGFFATAAGITKDGFTLYTTRNNTGLSHIMWIAEGV